MGYITKNGHTFFIPDVSDKETKPFLHDKKGMPIIKDTYRGYDWKELLKHRYTNATLPDGSPDPDRAYDYGIARKFRLLSRDDQNRFLNADHTGMFDKQMNPEDRIGSEPTEWQVRDNWKPKNEDGTVNDNFVFNKKTGRWIDVKTPADPTKGYADHLENMRDLHASTGDYAKFYGKNHDGTPNLEEY